MAGLSAGMTWHQTWKITGARAEIKAVIEQTQTAMASAGLGEAVTFAVRLSLEEALANAVRHGHGGDESLEFDVEATVTGRSVFLVVQDAGLGFDPQSVPDPTAEENLSIASGRGLALMRAFMTEVRVVPPGNRIEMHWSEPEG